MVSEEWRDKGQQLEVEGIQSISSLVIYKAMNQSRANISAKETRLYVTSGVAR